MSEQLFCQEALAKARQFAAAEHGRLIGGERQPAIAGQTFATFNPATKARLGLVVNAGRADVGHFGQRRADAFERGQHMIGIADRVAQYPHGGTGMSAWRTIFVA